MTFYGTDFPDVPDVDPYGETIDGAALLDEIDAMLSRFVAFPSEVDRHAIALWIVHTHALTAFETTPRLALLSPEPGSGKTRALEILELLVLRPLLTVNATPAYLFRKVADEAGPPTLLYDEIDTVFGPKAKDNEDIRGMLNAGYRRGATAGRCVIKGKSVEVEELPAFAACALAGLDDLPDTIMTRSIIIRMRRRAPSERVQSYRRRLHQAEGHELRDRISAWVSAHWSDMDGAWPDLPPGIEDRAADVWEPLLAVADAAGGHWPDRARVSAVSHVSDARANAGGLGVQLLADLRAIFTEAGADKLSTDSILIALHDLEESPWSDLRGKALDARGLAYRLKKYEISRKQIRVGEWTGKGYDAADLADAWSRYLPDVSDVPVPSDEGREIPPLGISEHGTRAPLLPATSETSETRETGRSLAGLLEAADPEGSPCGLCGHPNSETRHDAGLPCLRCYAAGQHPQTSTEKAS